MSRLLPSLPDSFLFLIDEPSFAPPEDVLVAGTAVTAEAARPAEAASADTPHAAAPSAEPADALPPDAGEPDAAGPDEAAPQPPPAAASTPPPEDAVPPLAELDAIFAANAAPPAMTADARHSAEAASESDLPSAGTPPAAAPSAEPVDASPPDTAEPTAAEPGEATPQPPPAPAFALPPEDAFPTLAELDAILAANATPPPGLSAAERAEIVALLGLDPAIADDPLLYAEILAGLPDPDENELLAQWEKEYDVPAPLPDPPDIEGEWQLG